MIQDLKKARKIVFRIIILMVSLLFLNSISQRLATPRKEKAFRFIQNSHM